MMFIRKTNRHLQSALCALLAVMILVSGFIVEPATAKAQDAPSADAGSSSTAPLCRFGVNVIGSGDQDISQFDVAALRVGWYLNYHAESTPSRPGGIDYAPVIRLRMTSSTTYSYSPSGAALTAAIAANPGAAWMIGNEPDRRDVGGQAVQDEMLPALYATAYHDLYHLIKEQDPTARIFAGSIVQPTPLRLKYLDLVLQSYAQQYGQGMPVDGWSIHNFILNERSCAAYNNDLNLCWGADIPPGLSETSGLVIENTFEDLQRTASIDLFMEQVWRFRQWMFDRGYRNTPLYLSEYGVLMPAAYGFPPSRVSSFMNQTFDFLLNTVDARLGYPADGNRLVQRLSWYSTSDNVNFNGYLFEKPAANQPFALTEMGQNYAAYTAGVSDQTDLSLVRLSFDPGFSLVANGATTVTITAQVGNSGNRLEGTSSTVSFYNGNPDAGGTLIGSAQPVQVRGCGEVITASVTWANVSPGDYTIFARVAPVSGEVNITNNTISTKYVFATGMTHLPLIRR